MVREIRNASLAQKMRGLTRSGFFFPVLLLIIVVLTIPVVYLVSQKPQDVRTRAAGAPSAIISTTPSSGNFSVGQQFTVDVVIDGQGQAFNAAQANVAVTGNITIKSLSLISPSSGGCNLTFINNAQTPTAADPSFTGAILNGSSSRCTLYTLTLQATALGTGNITISNASVKSYADSSEIWLSSQNGTYTVTSTTPVPTSSVTPTPTPLAPKSDLSFSPSSSIVQVGSTFTVQVRANTNGQLVNAFQSDISYPANLLSVVSVSNANSAFEIEVPTTQGPGTISLASGTITPKSGNILISTITFSANAAGTAPVLFVAPILTNSTTNTDDIKSFVNGSYTITTAATPTIAPNPTNTPTPTAIPTTPPQATATPLPTVIQPTPTGITTVPAPTIDSRPIATYNPSFTMTGSKTSQVTSILVNNSTTGVTILSSVLWQYTKTLTPGANNFIVTGVNSQGIKSANSTLGISLHRLGDINGDNVIDLTDVSIFGSDWKNTGTLNNILSDMNGDNAVDLTDFSIIAKAYGN